MDFSVSVLHNLEESIQNLSENVADKLKCGKMEDISREIMKNRSVTKENLIDIVLNMGTLISESRRVLRSALAKFDEQKTELLDNQRNLIKIQDELITCKTGKLEAVQETVKSEIQTFSEVVRKNCAVKNFTPAKLKQVVKSAINDDDRSKNFLIFGAAAEDDMMFEEYPLSDENFVSEMFENLKLKECVEKCTRVGKRKSDGSSRPIKVTMKTPDAVHTVLKEAKLLKTLEMKELSFDIKRVYLSRDRSEEERDIRRELVKEMKEKIKLDSSKRYYIRGKNVCTADEPAP